MSPKILTLSLKKRLFCPPPPLPPIKTPLKIWVTPLDWGESYCLDETEDLLEIKTITNHGISLQISSSRSVIPVPFLADAYINMQKLKQHKNYPSDICITYTRNIGILT